MGRLIGAALLAAGLIGCSDPPVSVPPEHADLVGTWKHGQLPNPQGSGPHVFVFVTLTRDGTLSYAWYRRSEDGHSCTVLPETPLTAISEHELEATFFWPFATELAIDRPPQREGDRWTMTVDGVELERVSPEVSETAASLTCDNGTITARFEGGDGKTEQAPTYKHAI